MRYRKPLVISQEDRKLDIWLPNQILPKSFKHSKEGVEHETTTTTFALPGLFGIKNKNRWSVFAGVTVIGGGGTLEYDDGFITEKGFGLTASQLPGFITSGGTAAGPILPEEVSSAWLGGVRGRCLCGERPALPFAGGKGCRRQQGV